MKRNRAIALAAATLVAGLVIGNVTNAFAIRPAEAPVSAPEATETACGAGLKLGPLMREKGGRLLDIVARATGLSTEEIVEQRSDGESLADIAESSGVSVEEIVDEALAQRSGVLEDLVAEERITGEQAEAMLDRMGERLTDRLTSTERGPKGNGGMGRGLGGGPRDGNGFGGGGGRGYGPGGGHGFCGGYTGGE